MHMDQAAHMQSDMPEHKSYVPLIAIVIIAILIISVVLWYVLRAPNATAPAAQQKTYPTEAQQQVILQQISQGAPAHGPTAAQQQEITNQISVSSGTTASSTPTPAQQDAIMQQIMSH